MRKPKLPTGRRGRIALALCGAVVAALVLGLSPVLAGKLAPYSPSPLLGALEGTTVGSHHAPSSVSVNDAKRRELCGEAAYRLANVNACPGLDAAGRAAERAREARCEKPAYAKADPAECPSLEGRVGARIKKAMQSGALSETGQWGDSFPVDGLNITAVLLPTGKVMWWAYPYNPDVTNSTVPPLDNTPAQRAQVDWAAAYIWDPRTGQTYRRDPPIDPRRGQPYDIWCGGQTFLRDGRLLVAGGNWEFFNLQTSQQFQGHDVLLTFNPFNETWTVQPKMSVGRWYPTTTLLPDGRVVILSGLDKTGDITPVVEVFTPSPDMDGVGTIEVKPSAARSTIFYPHLFLVPGGKLLLAGPGADDTGLLDTTTWTWSPLPNLPQLPGMLSGRREWGAATLLPGGINGPTQILLQGGSPTDVNYNDAPATNTTVIADIPALLSYKPGDPSPWRQGPSNLQARSHSNSTLLPDGSIFRNGGGRGSGTDGLFTDPVFSAELLPQGASQWIQVGTEQEERTYHSTSLLLPDGRVISSGDDRPEHSRDTSRNRTVQFYNPPYLYRGARPTIASAPAQAPYGATIGVGTPDAVSRVTLMKLGANTHALDVDQRLLNLPFTAAAGGVSVTLPSDPTAAPPGYYQLFVLNASGVPSAGSMIRIDAGLPSPSPTPGGPGAGQPPVQTQKYPAPTLKGLKAKVAFRGSTARITLRVKASATFSGQVRLMQARKVTKRVVVKGKKVTRKVTVYKALSKRPIAGVGNRFFTVVSNISTKGKRFPLKLRLQVQLMDRRGGPTRTINRGLLITKKGTKGTAKVLKKG
ncbi:MAG: galactose oxidase-like domain-containing protein [Thermoleophilia bacterium]